MGVFVWAFMRWLARSNEPSLALPAKQLRIHGTLSTCGAAQPLSLGATSFTR